MGNILLGPFHDYLAVYTLHGIPVGFEIACSVNVLIGQETVSVKKYIL